jgi:hypothetical protein
MASVAVLVHLRSVLHSAAALVRGNPDAPRVGALSGDLDLFTRIEVIRQEAGLRAVGAGTAARSW